MMWEAILSTWFAFLGWLSNLDSRFLNLGYLLLAGLALFGLIFIITWLLRREQRSQSYKTPSEALEPLIPSGEIRVDLAGLMLGDSDQVITAGQASYQLDMKLENPTPHTVQLFKLALKTPLMKKPVTLDLAQLIPPQLSVLIRQPLPEISGDKGELHIYLYVADTAKKYYRLRVLFEWEPENTHYIIAPRFPKLTPFERRARLDTLTAPEEGSKVKTGEFPDVF